MADRHQEILEILIRQENVTVAELSERLDVSEVTIRNDLNQLAEEGRVIRTHGGAQITDERTRQEHTFIRRQRINVLQKRRIGELAATLVEPFESILLDASTTAVAVGQALKRNPDLQELTVVTTGIFTALEMLGCPFINVILAGGHLRSVTGSATGSIANQALQSFNFQKVFLGASGLTLEDGLTDTPLMEVELKQTMLNRAQAVIAVIDGSKFGRTALASMASIDQISYVVTDETAPADLIEALRERGVRVLVATET